MSKEYYPQLDSIRGISFILIFIYHSVKINYGTSLVEDFISYIYNSLPLAIDIFFLLSSFLLTWLGLSEHRKNGSFSFKNYFTRRLLRIWPLYYIIMAFAFLLLPVIARILHISVSLPPASWYIFFISNFYLIDHVYFLKFLWTLSAEEQFYLMLGIFLKFFLKYIIPVFYVFFALSITFSIFSIIFDIRAYENTLTYLFDFAAGGMAAVALFNATKVARFLTGLSSSLTILFYSYLPVHFLFFYVVNKNCSTAMQTDSIHLISRYLFIIYLSLILMEQIVNVRRTKFFERNKFLVFTGKISFGLYCFHGITLTFANAVSPCMTCSPFFFYIRLVVIFVVNYGIAMISYYYIESPFLRLKERFRKV